ncbi:12551_t:CDS:2, partial [Funneliformis geosporum]
MVLKINIEKTLIEFETRFKELEQSNEELRSQFKYFEEKIREREVETKEKQKIINELPLGIHDDNLNALNKGLDRNE